MGEGVTSSIDPLCTFDLSTYLIDVFIPPVTRLQREWFNEYAVFADGPAIRNVIPIVIDKNITLRVE